jgi:hypothetical protein
MESMPNLINPYPNGGLAGGVQIIDLLEASGSFSSTGESCGFSMMLLAGEV